MDTFFVRIGDLLHAALVFVGVSWLGLSLRSFAWVNVVLIGGWMAVAVLLLRRYRRIADS